MASSIRVDLHCHSSFSDGQLAPEGVAHALHLAGVRYAALTDHDTLDGLPRFQDALAARGIGFVTGMEISASHPIGEIHILAYGFPLEHSPRAPAAIEASPPSSRGGMDGEEPNGEERLPSWQGKLRSSIDTAIRGMVGETSPLPVARVIGRIHDAGGLAFLAHPLSPCGDLQRAELLLAELKSVGLDGVEALYKPYRPDVRSSLVHLATRHGLLFTGGSDFHGNGVYGAHEPGCEIPLVDWERLSRALG